jgi:predicted glycosyltransferase
MTSTRRPHLLFYVQHLLGIGHIMRAATLTRALEAHGVAVTFVSGGAPVPGFESGASRFVQLPPTRAIDVNFKVLVDEHDALIDDAWRERRRDRLLSLYDETAPDIVLTEMYPFGRRQMRFEVEPLLDRARSDPRRPLIASSVRDILVEPDKPERVDEMVARVQRYFDLVLVHGDPALIPFDATFPRMREVVGAVRYTGYVTNPPPPRGGAGAPGHGEVIVSTGGGAVSEQMLGAAIDARPMTNAANKVWRVLIGHNLPDGEFDHWHRSVPHGMIVERARTDFAHLLRNCVLSISQGGYNTVMEILAAGTRAVCLPYAGGHESEQTIRCRLLADRGLIQIVEKDAVGARNVAAAVNRALASPPVADAGVDMSGAGRTAEVLLAALARA